MLIVTLNWGLLGILSLANWRKKIRNLKYPILSVSGTIRKYRNLLVDDDPSKVRLSGSISHGVSRE